MLEKIRQVAAIVIVSFMVANCGGSTSAPVPPPPPPPPAADIWADVKTAVDVAKTSNLHLVIGDANGEIFSYEKGSFPRTEIHRLASASKLLSSITIMRLAEQGTLSLDDHPQDYIPWWTNDPTDDRAHITLEHLLSFTSGFNYQPGEANCTSDGNITLEDCARDFYDKDIESVPGDVFYYGPAPLQIAAYMAEMASGVAYVDLFKTQVGDVLNLGSDTGFVTPSLTNPRASAGAQSNVDDYSEVQRALLAGELVSDMNMFARDRTDNATFGHRPAIIEDQNMDWHYGLGFWRECEAMVWNDGCANNIMMSSPGAYGWNPWLDIENNYYGLIAMDVSLLVDNGSVELKLALQPLIEAALAKR